MEDSGPSLERLALWQSLRQDSACLDAYETDTLVWYEIVKRSDRISTTAHTRNDDIRKPPSPLFHLYFDFTTDDFLVASEGGRGEDRNMSR